jgi:Amt family ammonium transporter
MKDNSTFTNNSEISEKFELLTRALDVFFLSTSGSVVLFMHAGFACLEAGSVRAKNATNILMKNWADLCFGKLWRFNLVRGFSWQKKTI